MDFTYKDERDTEGKLRRVLYPNKSNTPGKPDGEIALPADKPGMMHALQGLLDLVQWESEPETKMLSEETEIPNPGPEPKASSLGSNLITFPADAKELSTKEQLALRMLLTVHWEELPISFKADLVCLSMEDIRPHLDAFKAQKVVTTQEEIPDVS